MGEQHVALRCPEFRPLTKCPSTTRRGPNAGNRNQGSKWLRSSTRRRIYERDSWRCVWCAAEVFNTLDQLRRHVDALEGSTSKQPLRFASIDHVVPRSRGGTNEHHNLITCCMKCNAKRGDLSVPAFARALDENNAPVIIRRVRAACRRKLPER